MILLEFILGVIAAFLFLRFVVAPLLGDSSKMPWE